MDQGLAGNPKWFDVAYSPTGWHNIFIPGYWEDQGIRDLNGIVWYRKEIDIPASMTGKRTYFLKIAGLLFLYLLMCVSTTVTTGTILKVNALLIRHLALTKGMNAQSQAKAGMNGHVVV